MMLIEVIDDGIGIKQEEEGEENDPREKGTVEEDFTECEDREEYKFENGDVYKRMLRTNSWLGPFLTYLRIYMKLNHFY